MRFITVDCQGLIHDLYSDVYTKVPVKDEVGSKETFSLMIKITNTWHRLCAIYSLILHSQLEDLVKTIHVDAEKKGPNHEQTNDERKKMPDTYIHTCFNITVYMSNLLTDFVSH